MDDQQREQIAELNRQAVVYITQFLSGDSHAFHSLVHLYGQRVLRIVRKMIYSYHDAEDVYNEIWLKVAQNLHKFDQSLPFHAWLYRLVSNACIDFLRKKRDIAMEDEQIHYQLQKADVQQSDTPEARLLQKEFQAHLHELLKQLDETDRLIVTLRFSEQLSYDEIGELVGMSKNTVGTRLFRARKQLKEMFEHQVRERRMVDATY
ncbi:sigma-70 family RNA polymerase sigma factor [Brevibacillus sp. SYP-B805]|uniref:RNA polymerase sigma factor n=1 Tax=Brevibacillus sp. SYP-B805 TaxID=1578199 RepID=UPI0013EDEFE2|nr:sigma-70 family RNA polymerase sigma factor [Brevibacillus sp. SYP-B805]NGQ95083.1 sigma-70 family RNA polymerase sigma factor [Brevibacillus sp. SYP-B805]